MCCYCFWSPPHPKELSFTCSLSKHLLYLLCAEWDSKWRLTTVTRVNQNPSPCRADSLSKPDSDPSPPPPTALQGSHCPCGKRPGLPLGPNGPRQPTPHLAPSLPSLPLSLPLVTLLQPHRPPPCSSNMPGLILPQGLCMGRALCFAGSSSRYHRTSSRFWLRYQFLRQDIVHLPKIS